jgi:murein DD-endopeptidase MepM/ murein hydrolase activator NlpD
MKKLLALLGTAALAATAGCGSGQEPLSAIGTANGGTPQLSLPIQGTALTVTTISSFSQSGAGGVTASDGFNFNIPAGANPQVFAPGPGIVTYVDTTPGAGVVYIYHNAHLTSRISQLTSTSVQVGQVVQGGGTAQVGQISNSLGTTILHFTVFFDGGVVCPLGYLTPSDQNKVNGHLISAVSPCL